MTDVPQLLLSCYVHNNLRASELPGVRRRCMPQKELEDERLGEDASGGLYSLLMARMKSARLSFGFFSRVFSSSLLQPRRLISQTRRETTYGDVNCPVVDCESQRAVQDPRL
ncbi:hypothetical protein MHYP_G00129400 [Metynnis hypsauchen]